MALNVIISQIQKYVNRVEDAKKAIEDLANSYDNTKSEIDEINNKLEENKKLIEEMNNKPLDNIEKDNLTTLQEENTQLTAKKETLQAIADLENRQLKREAAEFLADNEYAVTLDNTITSSFWEKFKDQYNKTPVSPADGMGSIGQAFASTLLANVDYLEATQTLIDNISNQMSDLENLNLFEGFNTSDSFNTSNIIEYINETKNLDKSMESLKMTISELEVQQSYFSPDDKEYEEIEKIINQFDDIYNRYKNPELSFAEELLKNYQNEYEDFETVYDKTHNKILKKEEQFNKQLAKKSIISKEYSSDDVELSDEARKILFDNNIVTNTEQNKLLVSDYDDIIGALKEINELKKQGLYLDTEGNNAIFNTLLKMAGITEDDIPILEFDEQMAAYDFIQSYFTDNNIDTASIGAAEYKNFVNGLEEEAKKNGTNTAYMQNILAGLFPNYQDNKSLFDAYIEQTAGTITDLFLEEAIRGTLDESDLTGNEKFIADLKDMEISAHDAVIQLRELANERLKARVTDSKDKADTIASKSLANRSDYEENYRDNFEVFSSAIESTKNNTSLTSDEMWKLISLDATLAQKFTRTTDGYIIATNDLIAARDKYNRENTSSFKSEITNTKNAIAESNRVIADLTTKRDSIQRIDGDSVREWAYWDSLISQEKKNLNSLNSSLSANQLLYEESLNPIFNYAEAISTVSSQISTLTSLYEKIRNEMSKTGKVSGDTLAEIINNVPNWDEIVSLSEDGTSITVDETAFKEVVKSSTGYDVKMAEAEEQVKRYEEELKKLAVKYGVAYDSGKSFEENLANIREKLKTSPQFTGEVADEFNMLSSNMSEAETIVNLLRIAFEQLFESFEENTFLTDFNTAVEDLQHKKNLGQISEKAYTDAYANAYNTFKNAVGETSDPELIDALNTAEETNYSNYQSSYQNEYAKEKSDLENAYSDKLKTGREYYDELERLNEEYYGENGKINDIDGTTYEDNLRDLTVNQRASLYDDEIANIQKDYEDGIIGTIADLENALAESATYWLEGYPELEEKLNTATEEATTYLYEQSRDILDRQREQGLISTTDYTRKLKQVWETYYKDKDNLRQEDYEAEQAVISSARDSVSEQIDGLQSIIDKNTELADSQIEALEEQKELIEEQYDTLISQKEEEIELIEDKADEEDRYLNILKAEAELRRALSQKTVGVMDANGVIQYVADPNAVREAEENYRNALNESAVDVKTKEKEELEEQRDSQTEIIDELITAINDDTENKNEPYEILIEALSSLIADKFDIDYDFLTELLQSEDAQRIINNRNAELIEQGKDPYVEKVLEKYVEVADESLNAEGTLVEQNEEILTALERADMNKISDFTPQVDTTSKENEQTKSDITSDSWKYTALMNTPIPTTFTDSVLSAITPAVNTYQDITNQNNNNSYSFGDIVINNPIGNSNDLANELIQNFGSAIDRQIYTVRR